VEERSGTTVQAHMLCGLGVEWVRSGCQRQACATGVGCFSKGAAARCLDMPAACLDTGSAPGRVISQVLPVRCSPVSVAQYTRVCSAHVGVRGAVHQGVLQCGRGWGRWAAEVLPALCLPRRHVAQHAREHARAWCLRTAHCLWQSVVFVQGGANFH
jgi:hypothetical protein